MSGFKRSIGFRKGRLCKNVDGEIQAFLLLEWRGESSVAPVIDLHLMESKLDWERSREKPIFFNSPF